MSSMLRVEGIRAGYGDVTVLRDVAMHVDEGEIVALLGLNGAGKTTLLRVITGMLRPQAGEVVFSDQVITGKAPHEIVRMRVGMVPEGKQLWPQMTVDDHLQVALSYSGVPRDERKRKLEYVYGLFPVLAGRRKSRASEFSGGEQQMLAIGRALVTDPQLLLLDEPSLGLAPKVVTQVLDVVSKVRAEGVTILLVEQSVRQALGLADRTYFLDHGVIGVEHRRGEMAAGDDAAAALLGMVTG
jgi:branched-chain amino acid transport system ATP-binding protein